MVHFQLIINWRVFGQLLFLQTHFLIISEWCCTWLPYLFAVDEPIVVNHYYGVVLWKCHYLVHHK